MSALAEKIRKSRESVIEAGGFQFTIRRPTDMEMVEFYQKRDPKQLLRFVVGWGRVRELDLFPGGDPHPAKFDPEACEEWLSDRADLFSPVVTGITDAYQAHKSAMEDAEKK